MDQAPSGSSGQTDVKDTHGDPLVQTAKSRQKGRRKHLETDEEAAKRRCVSTACVACRKRKSKCDGNTPSCAACAQVYRTECFYDQIDYRRKGVYKNDIDNLKTRNLTLKTVVQAILNYPEEDVPALVQEIRTCESLDAVAERIVAREQGTNIEYQQDEETQSKEQQGGFEASMFETTLYAKMGDLRLDEGSVRYIGGTSNLIHLTQEDVDDEGDEYPQQDNAITSWTTVTDDPDLIMHLLYMYFTWHYAFFCVTRKSLFLRDFFMGKPPANTRRKTWYCTPLLVNAMLALGCHFTSHPGAREDPNDSATAGDHFFKAAKRLILENDEHERPRLTTVQALALLSVREAGCGREAKGWVYSGMSFRMAYDMGLNLDTGRLTTNRSVNGDEAEEDVRRITFWGCFLFDKCWSNYLGRLPQLPPSLVTVPKFEVFPDEEASQWSPYTDSGFVQANTQPSRTRTVALQISKLCEISADIMRLFYNPSDMEKTRSKAAELKKLSDIHQRLERWRRELPHELEPKEGCLSSIIIMHMFFQILFIHLFRPFLKYTQATSPLPQTVSPRKLCTSSAAAISKLMRLYKRSYGLRQICNIAVYIAHSACTIHLLNLPDKCARRDIVHGVKHLEEIAEGWLCARRTLAILSVLARKWKVELPEDAAAVFARTDIKYGSFLGEVPSPPAPPRSLHSEQMMDPSQFTSQTAWQNPAAIPLTVVGNPAQASHAAPSASTVRKNGGSFALPTNDTKRSSVQQHSSAAATPPPAERSNHKGESASVRSATSPSEMFGGIKQLIRDSQEWAYRDQAQFAIGFENWNSLDGIDPAGWTNGLATASGFNNTSSSSVGETVGVAVGINGMSQFDAGRAYASTGMASNAVFGFPTAGWLNGTPNITTYNEDEWYQ